MTITPDIDDGTLLLLLTTGEQYFPINMGIKTEALPIEKKYEPEYDAILSACHWRMDKTQIFDIFTHNLRIDY